MPQWFYREGEDAVGPFTSSDLLELVRHQTVTGTTMVRKGESAWFPASDVGGLFAAAARPTVEYSCPECGSEVDKPPTYCRRCRRRLDYARPRVIENRIEGYEKPETDQESISGAWKQWVRRLRQQRQNRSPDV